MNNRGFSIVLGILVVLGLGFYLWHRFSPAPTTVVAVSPPVAPQRTDLNVGMFLEPPGLDPTTGSASAIAEITMYNLFEGLTKVTERGEVMPLLAESWTISDDHLTYTFKLRQNVKFQNGEPLVADAVKFTYERNAAENSLNKRKATFVNMASIEVPDAATVVIKLNKPNSLLLYNLGEATAAILEPKSAGDAATKPVGTGPYKLQDWNKGSSVTLVKAESYRAPADIKIEKVTFKFITDPAAMVAAVLAGDIDLMPNIPGDAVAQIKNDGRFVLAEGTTEGETILAMNNSKKPFDDIRVRRAVAHAIDRKALIDGANNGYGTPIGSHFAPHNPAYVDLTDTYPHDVAKAKALLAEAGLADGFEATLAVPPPPYARRGSEVIAAQLGAVGIRVKIENMEWAQWLDQVLKNANYDLSIISHVEPNDILIYANPNYYFRYDSAEFRALIDNALTASDDKTQAEAFQAAQRKLAEDSVNGFLFQLPRLAVYRKELQGVWKNASVFVNDVTVMSWQ